MGSDYSHCANEKLQLKVKIETKLLKLSLGGKKPKQDVSKEWDCSLHTK